MRELSIFIPNWRCECSMIVCPENTRMSKKVIKQKIERHTPLNPPSMGEEIEQFPSVEGCRFFGGEGAFCFFDGYPETMNKEH